MSFVYFLCIFECFYGVPCFTILLFHQKKKNPEHEQFASHMLSAAYYICLVELMHSTQFYCNLF